MNRHPLPMHHMMVGVRAALRCYELPPAAPEFDGLLARLAASEAALESARRAGGAAGGAPRVTDESAPSLGSRPLAARRPRAKFHAFGARWQRLAAFRRRRYGDEAVECAVAAE